MDSKLRLSQSARQRRRRQGHPRRPLLVERSAGPELGRHSCTCHHCLVGGVTVHVHSERFHSFAFVRQFSRKAIRFAGAVNSDAPSLDLRQMGLAVVINSCLFRCVIASRFRSARSPISGIHCPRPNLPPSQPEPFRLSSEPRPSALPQPG